MNTNLETTTEQGDGRSVLNGRHGLPLLRQPAAASCILGFSDDAILRQVLPHLPSRILLWSLSGGGGVDAKMRHRELEYAIFEE